MTNDYFLKQLLDKIGGKSFQIIPVIKEDFAKVNNCFFNVKEKVEKFGGKIIYGWEIQRTQIICEAQRHAIWLSQEGKLFDITPKLNNQKIAYFVEDKDWIFSGKMVDNVRINVTNNPMVDDLILISETIGQLNQVGSFSENGEFKTLNKIEDTVKVLERMKDDLEAFIVGDNDMNSICFCCNEKLYKECFGATLNDLMNLVIQKTNDMIIEYNTSR